jgi:hypothetical protein
MAAAKTGSSLYGFSHIANAPALAARGGGMQRVRDFCTSRSRQVTKTGTTLAVPSEPLESQTDANSGSGVVVTRCCSSSFSFFFNSSSLT